MINEPEPKTHVFLKPCGCLSAAYVDVPHNYNELAKGFKYATKHNETYQLMETQKVREMEWKCPEHKKKATK